MKITQLMLAKGFGGAERYFVDLSLALVERGHTVQAICHRRFQEKDRLHNHPGLQLVTLPVHGWWDLLAARKIKTTIQQFTPTVVQAHLARGSHIAGKACAGLDLPLVVKTHNYVNLKYYRNVVRFIATTSSQKTYLTDNGVAAEKINVVPNFSSLDPVAAVETPLNTPLHLATYGRLVRKKGFHILLESFRKFLDRGQEARLTIGGDGPELKALQRQSRQSGLEQSVTFSGWVTNVAGFLRDAHVFVLPSLDEPFGIAVLEAMALGKPIVTTATAGPVEILDEETAFFAVPGDAGSLADALVAAAGNEAARLEKARRALALFNRKYHKAVVVDRVLNIYRSVSS